MLDAVPGLIALVDRLGVVQWVSRSVVELGGYTEDELIGSNMLDHVDLTWNPWTLESISYAWDTPGMRLPTILRFMTKDGTPILMEATSNNQLHDPAIGAVLTQLRPCEERELVDQILEALASGEERASTLERVHAVAACDTLRADAAVVVHAHDDAGHGLDVIAPGSHVTALTATGGEATPWASSRASCQPVILPTLDGLPAATRAAAEAAGYRACWTYPVGCRSEASEAAAVIVLWRREEGLPEPSATMLAERLARLTALVLERFESARRLLHAASHDPLTGLANRVQFFDHIDHHLDDGDGSLGVLYLDLDGFKAVNDRFGHGSGDDVLTEVGARLRAAVRPGDLVARLGGDEFAVSCPGADLPQLVHIAERLIEVLPVEVPTADGADRGLTIGVSIGLAAATAGSCSSDVLVDAADRALLSAKAVAKGSWRSAEVPVSPRS